MSKIMKEFKFEFNYIFHLHGFFKATLFLSIFSFSAVNFQLKALSHQAVNTELVESIKFESSFKLFEFSKSNCNILTAGLSSNVYSFNAWALINHNKLIATRINSYRKKILFCIPSSLKLYFRIKSSSKKEVSPHLSTF